ncbi:MAG TPA: hypothetical protein VGK00_11670 [Anaerolineales bacterium]|jgi:hypothetical protein
MDRWDANDPAQPRQDPGGCRESRKANAALRDYLRLGADRSLEALLSAYASHPQPPTRSLHRLKSWCSRYDWPERAELYDQLQLAGETERHRQAMQSGLALAAGRVENLKQLYAEMQSYLAQAWPVWVADLQGGTAQAGSAERSRVPRFNTGILIQMRGILDDLARETGGRISRSAAQIDAQLERSPDEYPLPNLKLLSQDELDTLNRLIQKTLPAEAPGPLWQPSLPGFMD